MNYHPTPADAADGNAVEQVAGANLSADTVKAGRNLDEVVATLLRNFGAGSDYFKVLPVVLMVLVVLAVHGLSTLHVSVSFTALPLHHCSLRSLSLSLSLSLSAGAGEGVSDGAAGLGRPRAPQGLLHDRAGPVPVLDRRRVAGALI